MADSNLSGHVWPEDTGTGAAGGNEDWDSAGYLAGMAAQDNRSDYVERGLRFTVDFGALTFDLSAGLAFIKSEDPVDVQNPSDDAGTYSGTWDQGVTFAVDVDAETGIALTDSATNYIYLAIDLSSNDSHYVHVDTDDTAPSDPSIKIGEIDTANDSVDIDFNRVPVIDAKAGHDEVDLPQVRNLTVADFESGTLDTDVWEGDTGQFNVQSSVVESGNYALEGTSPSSVESLYAGSGLENYLQPGDTIEYFTYHSNKLKSWFGILGAGNTVAISHNSDGEQLRVNTGEDNVINSVTIPLNEWMRTEVIWGLDGSFTVSFFDASENELWSTTANSPNTSQGGRPRFRVWDIGGVGGVTAYWDSGPLKRREPEAAANTQKGITEAGNELSPSGGIHTGPQEVPPDHPNYPVVNLPVTDQLSQGDPVGYHLSIAEEKVLTVEAEADGSGGIQNRFIGLNQNGAGFYVNSSGEVVVVDEAGNETVIS